MVATLFARFSQYVQRHTGTAESHARYAAGFWSVALLSLACGVVWLSYAAAMGMHGPHPFNIFFTLCSMAYSLVGWVAVLSGVGKGGGGRRRDNRTLARADSTALAVVTRA